MQKKFLLFLILVIFFKAAAATVFVTHGLGTQGISYYQNSAYVDLIKEAAKDLGHELVGIPWLDESHQDRGFAGILPQERIRSAVGIAKSILEKIKAGEKIVLIGHGYGGQVMACATRLINPENHTLKDLFIYELFYTIKNYGNDEAAVQTRSISPVTLFQAIAWGWKISKAVFDVVESSNLVNQGLIKLIKQNLSLKFIEETKSAWNDASKEVQAYAKKLFKDKFDCKNRIHMIYTAGTVFGGDNAFLPDMKVVEYHVNFYSKADSIVSYAGGRVAPQNSRSTNINVLFEPTRAYDPKHSEFCGNIFMAKWILQIPEELKLKKVGGFDSFRWGKGGAVTFCLDKAPVFTSGV
jgi:hypothetical protein